MTKHNILSVLCRSLELDVKKEGSLFGSLEKSVQGGSWSSPAELDLSGFMSLNFLTFVRLCSLSKVIFVLVPPSVLPFIPA